jgi:hypothetical protein
MSEYEIQHKELRNALDRYVTMDKFYYYCMEAAHRSGKNKEQFLRDTLGIPLHRKDVGKDKNTLNEYSIFFPSRYLIAVFSQW